VTGFGGDQGGTGVVGIAGGVVGAGLGIEPVTGQNAGVYGTGVAGLVSKAAVGVIGQGGPATTGVVGLAGTGTADGVRASGPGASPGSPGSAIPRAPAPGSMAKALVRVGECQGSCRLGFVTSCLLS
jgi:hypothetical protein